MARTGKLTALKADKVKASGYYGDGGGLFLQVSKYGSKSWVFRFKANGRLREMGLGSFNTYTLAKARERARECRSGILSRRQQAPRGGRSNRPDRRLSSKRSCSPVCRPGIRRSPNHL